MQLATANAMVDLYTKLEDPIQHTHIWNPRGRVLGIEAPQRQLAVSLVLEARC